MLNTEVYCLSCFSAKPEYREKLINELIKLVEPTRAERGCLQYDLLVDNKNPLAILLVEKFISAQALANHQQQPYVKHFVENVMEALCEKIEWVDATEIRV